MRVSVVIPCHNAARWIGAALRSVAAQTLTAHEIIVVNDASTDMSPDAVRESGVNAKLLSVNFRNAAAARNAGIEIATGDWIALLDADDLWYPNHLARAAEVLAGSADVAYRAMCDDLDTTGVTFPVTWPQPITVTRTGLTHQEYIEFENQVLYFGHSSCVIKRDRLWEIGGYNPEQVRRHDIDMWLRLIHDRTWTWDTVPTAAYRVDTPGSICRSYAECEFYFLQALIRNESRYPYPAMHALLTKSARKVMTLGFTDDTAEDSRRARKLAWPYLPTRIKLAYTLSAAFPSLARALIRAKRELYGWRTGHRMPELSPPPEPRKAATN